MADKKTKDAAAKKKSDKPRKPGIFQRAARYFRDTRGEWKRVVWPSRKTVVNNTVVVLVVVLLSAVVIFILDAVFGFGLSTVLDLLAKV